jgi:hypothetical protein
LIFGNPVIAQIRTHGTADPDEIVAAATVALHRAFQAIVLGATGR